MIFLVISAIISLFAVTGILFLYLRPKFPVRVYCWFCGEKSTVPYGNKNCWDCPSCDQYNGFSQDGDYNKPIPAQYSEYMNYPLNCVSQGDFISKDNVLCQQCNQNQLLKIKQLAGFIPLNEANYDSEVERYEKHLDQVYALCEECQADVNTEIDQQNRILSLKLQELQHETFDSTVLTSMHDSHLKKDAMMFIPMTTLLDICAFSCGVVVCLPEAKKHKEEVIPFDTQYIASYCQVIAVSGLILSTIAKILLGKHRLVPIDALHIPVWALVLLLSTDWAHDLIVNTQLELVTPACFVLNALLCLTSVIMRRQDRSQNAYNVRRHSLNSTGYSDVTESSPIPSASEHCYSTLHQPNGAVPAESNHHYYSTSHQTDQPSSEMDETLSELGAFSIGSASQKRPDSGTFTQTSFASGRPVSVAGFSFTNSLHERRPLISPAKFRINKSENIFLSTSKEAPCNSLFTNTNHEFSSSKSDISGFGKSSVFGETPFKMTSQTDHRRKQTFTEVPNYRSPPVRSLYEDRESSASSRCQVDSTTVIDEKAQFWKSPGFLGFVMGASIVANLALGFGVWQKS